MKSILELVEEAEVCVKNQFKALDDIMTYNQYKVLSVTAAAPTLLTCGLTSAGNGDAMPPR